MEKEPAANMPSPTSSLDAGLLTAIQHFLLESQKGVRSNKIIHSENNEEVANKQGLDNVAFKVEDDDEASALIKK